MLIFQFPIQYQPVMVSNVTSVTCAYHVDKNREQLSHPAFILLVDLRLPLGRDCVVDDYMWLCSGILMRTIPGPVLELGGTWGSRGWAVILRHAREIEIKNIRSRASGSLPSCARWAKNPG